ncbi:biotin-dependent carboxyltransferase family protein [Sediminibacterium sp.]|uniref:5-oxoprolinase subunit C family protein n=1 Tax=Sediminibacterium sp. TaxID=1917865 RepID=UPI0025F59114|nr:biotin-dependent carboxyltransferase family protein [Sediminibacterium sp.]MBW0176706.1 biotin-dependent carboxyltransferase family protein [Sediminibacterium sp.]
MSIRIIKKGLLDTIQDRGRYGYQHLGINPTGVMDFVSMRLANALAGNEEQEPVIEMHWPAPVIRFETDTCFAISGAAVIARIDQQTEIPVNRTVFVKAGSQLSFEKKLSGARIYLAVQNGFNLTPWLNSNSTHLQLNHGGHHLTTGAVVEFNKALSHTISITKFYPWYIQSPIDLSDSTIHFTRGKEWGLLDETMKELFKQNIYQISNESNRMGYRLNGTPVYLQHSTELISTAVTKGTIQLLPNGQPLVLLADHQTTGGYPRIGHVISADVPKLAQFETGQSIRFKEITIEEAHQRLKNLDLYLKQTEIACKLRMADL